MKAKFRTSLYLLAICAISFTHTNAQKRSAGSSASNYTTALGLGVDFGNGSSYVGPSIKHFFTKNNVGKAEVLFGNYSTTLVSAYYQYHGDIENASGLKYTLGLGGSGFFYSERVLFRNRNSKAYFAFRPTAGLDFKIPNVPIEMEFDWRPAFFVTSGGGTEAGRFGFGFRYCFK